MGIRATEGIVRAVGKGKEADDLEKKRQGIVDKVGEKTEKFVGHAAPNLIGLGISAATFNPVGIAANTIGLGGSIARDSIEEANEGKGNDKVNKGTRVAGDVASGISTANTVLGFLRRRSRSTGVGNNGAHEFSGQHKRLVFIEARNSYY